MALTSFVGLSWGRAAAVRAVAGLLDQYRLVTVTGPGGSGKTRLAGQVAEQVAGRFADGVWLAELAAVEHPTLVAALVAVTLGIREQPGIPLAHHGSRAEHGGPGDNPLLGSPFSRSSAGQSHDTSNRTNGHFGAMTSTNVGYLPRTAPLDGEPRPALSPGLAGQAR